MMLKKTSKKKNSGKRKRAFLFLFLLPFWLFTAPVNPYYLKETQLLSIEDTQNPQKSAVFPLEEGEEFIIQYTHSVDLLPVREIFFCWDGDIYLRETIFSNFGAGMGLLEERGIYLEEEGMLKISAINEKVDPFVLRIGYIADHTLFYRGREHSLVNLFGDQSRLALEIK
jgi:hypothetical protein